MDAKEKIRAILKGPALRHLLIACLIILGVLTAGIEVSALFRGASAGSRLSSAAEEITMGGQWKIMRGDAAAYAQAAFDDSRWDSVSVPSNTAFPGGGQSAVCDEGAEAVITARRSRHAAFFLQHSVYYGSRGV